MEREENGRFKYKTARQLAGALSIGIDAETRRRRVGYLYRAIGPVSAADKKKQVPYLGDWDMLRSQTFIGEMMKDNVLFGSPTMKTMRAALREHVDVTHTAKNMAEVLLGWLARCETWARQIDQYFGYKAFDKKLSLKQNKQRFAEYLRLQESLRMSTVSTIEQILNCYGVGRGGMDLLAQLMVASKLQGQANEHAYETILAGLTGVETFDGKAAGGGVDAAASSEDPNNDSYNRTLKLLCASLADKAITYKMPHAELNIPGVPDVDDQETTREHIKRQVRGMMPDSEGKKIQ